VGAQKRKMSVECCSSRGGASVVDKQNQSQQKMKVFGYNGAQKNSKVRKKKNLRTIICGGLETQERERSMKLLFGVRGYKRLFGGANHLRESKKNKI